MAMDIDEGPCGVCIDGGDGDLPEFSHDVERRARKAHRCCECRETIPKGATYEYTVGKWDGRIIAHKTCLPCVEIRNALCCDGWTYTMLWEEAREGLFEHLTTGCLAQLTTAAAKTKLLAAWREWKGLEP